MQEPHEYELAVKVAQFQVAHFSEKETVPIPLDRNNTDSNIYLFVAALFACRVQWWLFLL